jgi:hypothetical protein
LWECALLTDAESVSDSGVGGMGWVSAVPISSVEGSPENKQIGQEESSPDRTSFLKYAQQGNSKSTYIKWEDLPCTSF